MSAPRKVHSAALVRSLVNTSAGRTSSLDSIRYSSSANSRIFPRLSFAAVGRSDNMELGADRNPCDELITTKQLFLLKCPEPTPHEAR